MNRRQLLKTLGLVPVVGVVTSAVGASPEQSYTLTLSSMSVDIARCLDRYEKKHGKLEGISLVMSPDIFDQAIQFEGLEDYRWGVGIDCFVYRHTRYTQFNIETTESLSDNSVLLTFENAPTLEIRVV